MTLDDFKSKTMKKNQSDQKSHEEKAKGLHFHSPWRWYTAIVTLGIMCVGLLVTIIVQVIQLSQVSNLLKQQQANLTLQENVLEGQFLAQKEAEKSSQESQRELKAIIEALSKKLDEESKEKMELHRQNLNLQEALKKSANYSGLHPKSKCPL
ncbi:oxidized low-density lipoprotein receptor 1 isoform X1 [Suncus etruscus]|uniref:oxidized low-density lipoprotein receptor 1 isoform X1 n=1 Tax=Suncus etruscus TaxID=109475 RepID=UPI00210F5257|nr:oxidized low-density lipoprotein receptor 1 isoform X1 [Suncus etruscus]